MRELSVTSYALKEKLFYIVSTRNIFERIDKSGAILDLCKPPAQLVACIFWWRKAVYVEYILWNICT